MFTCMRDIVCSLKITQNVEKKSDKKGLHDIRYCEKNEMISITISNISERFNRSDVYVYFNINKWFLRNLSTKRSWKDGNEYSLAPKVLADELKCRHKLNDVMMMIGEPPQVSRC